MATNVFRIQKYSNKVFAAYHDKSPRSFLTWIKPWMDDIGPKRGWDWDPIQVAKITGYVGIPKDHILSEEDKEMYKMYLGNLANLK